jgi:hypothetical protein
MMRRISFAAAVSRAGSLETVLAHLRAGDVMAYHAGLYNKDGRPISRKDDHIPVEWWKTARDIDPVAGRAWFRRYIIYDLAIGIELEAGAADALWPPEPEQSQSASAASAGMTAPAEKKSAKGPAKPRKPSHPRHPAWKLIFKHFDHHVVNHGKWLNAHAAANDVFEWADDKDLGISFDAIYEGISKWRPEWIEPDSKE